MPVEVVHTHRPGSVTPAVEGGMSVNPSSTVPMNGGDHCKKTHQEKPSESHFPANKQGRETFRTFTTTVTFFFVKLFWIETKCERQ
jgi:hypothetical protein